MNIRVQDKEWTYPEEVTQKLRSIYCLFEALVELDDDQLQRLADYFETLIVSAER